MQSMCANAMRVARLLAGLSIPVSQSTMERQSLSQSHLGVAMGTCDIPFIAQVELYAGHAAAGMLCCVG